MREIIQPRGGIADADPIKSAEDLPARRLAPHAAMQREHFVQLLLNGVQRVERDHRLLKDHRYLVAAQRAQPPLANAQQILTVKQNLAGGVARRRRGQQLHRRKRRYAFA